MIWDLHSHLSREAGTPHERIAKIIALGERMGVRRFVFMLGIPPPVPNPSPRRVRRENDELLQALEHWHDRAVGFVYLNPNHLAFSLDEFDRCVRDGPMVGIKLWVAKACSDPALDPILERAVEQKAVVFQHAWFNKGGRGNMPGESTPRDVVELARRHPEASIICGHGGGDWELGVRTVRGEPNVAFGLAGFDPTAGVVEMAVRELGAERLIYGSDVAGRCYASQLAKVVGADVSEKDKRLALGANLRRLLDPIFKAKGIDL